MIHSETRELVDFLTNFKKAIDLDHTLSIIL